MSFVKKILLLNILSILLPVAIFAQLNTGCSIKQNGIMLSWKHITATGKLKLPSKQASAQLPRKYSVYITDAAKLRKFLSAIKNNANTQTEIVLPLSEQSGCAAFQVIPSGTLSPELSKKFPQLVSLKGTAVQDKNTSVRLDYNGSELNAEILQGGVSYIIAPWKKGKKTYYLVYKKEDSGVEKKPFEEPPVNTSNR